MFNNRFWLLKAAVALLLFAALGIRSDRILRELYPIPEQSALMTDDLRGKPIVLWGRKVLSADASGFEIGSRVGPIRILTPVPPPPGAYISAIGTAVAPRTLSASSVQINAGWEWKRPLNYILSSIVVVAYLWSIRKLFTWRIRDGVLRGRY